LRRLETRTVAVEASESTESRTKGRAAPPEEPCRVLVAERKVAAAISGVSLRDRSPSKALKRVGERGRVERGSG
jgi:hypothetical protein